MNCYEALLAESYDKGLTVKEKPLKYNNGRIKGNRIAIRQDIETTTEKVCVLAEEMGHHYTTVGNILDQSNVMNRKQELKARLWAYDDLIGLQGIIDAYQHGCKNQYEMADFLNVTEEFLINALTQYKNKYGLYKQFNKYLISFEPLGVLELYK